MGGSYSRRSSLQYTKVRVVLVQIVVTRLCLHFSGIRVETYCYVIA